VNSPPSPLEWKGGPRWASAGGDAGPPAANAPALAYDSTRKVLVLFGGYRATPNKNIDETWEWSAGGGFVQRSLPRSPSPRLGHVMVYDSARSRIVLFGGSAGRPLDDTWEYDGTTWTERSPSVVPPPRVAACAAYDSARKVSVVFGGRSNDQSTSLSDTWEWDGTTWRQGPSGPPPRRSCAMTFDKARNVILMYGGSPRRANEMSESLGDTWAYE
jgi:Galactose oxidase, central domain